MTFNIIRVTVKLCTDVDSNNIEEYLTIRPIKLNDMLSNLNLYFPTLVY